MEIEEIILALFKCWYNYKTINVIVLFLIKIQLRPELNQIIHNNIRLIT